MRSRVIQGETSPVPPAEGGQQVPVVELSARRPATLPPAHRRKEFAMRTVVTRHSMIAFVLLAYAISWCMLPFGTFVAGGPLIAAVVVAALVDGWRGLRRLGGRIVRWRVGWVWYAAAIALPVAAHAITMLGMAVTGGPAPSLASWSPWYSLLLVAAVRLVNPLDGPLGEEPAWRGFAQPRLQATRSPLRATGILCLVVTGWHLPLYFVPAFGLRPFEVLTTAACTVVFAWLFNRSGGSVLIPLIAHVVEGTTRVTALWPADADIVQAKVWYSASWASIALALLLLDRRSWASAPDSARDVTPDADQGRRPLAELSTERARHDLARN